MLGALMENTALKKYITHWWLPLLSYALVVLLFVIAELWQRNWILDAALTVLLVGTLVNILGILLGLRKRKWYSSILHLLTSLCLLCVFGVYYLLSSDYYGANKTIPHNRHFAKMHSFNQVDLGPVHAKDPMIDIKRELERYDLVLAESFQPGIYQYYTDYKPSEDGHLYIRAYEVTSNDRLSERAITRASNIQCLANTAALRSKEFKIYEGDWGDKYGARIELWFKLSSGSEEYRVTSRNYIVEGWMH